MSIRSFVVRIAAVGIGLLVAVALAEAVLRLLQLAPTGGVATVTQSEFERVPGIFSPNQRVLDLRIRALPHTVRIDSLGYRGPDFPRQKVAGEFRAVLAGDSFTYGEFVEDEETLPARLERELRAVCRGARVINAGLGGSTIPDQVRMVERSLVLAPDLVTVVFSENDLIDLAGSSMWHLLAGNRQAKSRFPLSLLYPVLRQTALWNLALHVRGARHARRAAAAARVQPAHGGRVDSTGEYRVRERYRRELAGLRDTLAARGIPLVFAVYPSHLTMTGETGREPVDWAVETGRRVGIPTVNLFEPLRASRLPATVLYLLPHDGHPSARGHAIAAAYLAERLRAEVPAVASCGAATVPR